MIPVYSAKLRKSVIRLRFFNVGFFLFDIGACLFAIYTHNDICAVLDAFFAGIMLMLAYHTFTFYNLNPENPYGIHFE